MNAWQKSELSRWLSMGLSSSQIAQVMGCSPQTVRRNARLPAVQERAGELNRLRDQIVCQRVSNKKAIDFLLGAFRGRKRR